MQKIKETLKNNQYSFVSFAFVTTILCILYILNGLAPFGKNVAMMSDSFHQYIPLLSQLMDKIKAGDSLIYALSTGLGTSEIGNIINYTFSPFTWLILLFGQENLEIGFGISVIIKASLSAFTMNYFLNKKTETQDLMQIGFSTMYALSSYFLAYYWNIMWMDALYMLPLIAYGIHLLIKEKKFAPYILALSYAIITNYYMGFMLCIGSVVYYLYEYFITKSIKNTINTNSKNPILKYEFLNIGLLFAISSIVAAGIACFAILPMYDVLASTSAVANAKPSGIDFYSPIAVMTTNFFGNVTSFYTNPTNTGIVPNVYCGILTLLCIPVMFANKDISKKEKITTACVIGFFFLSFCTNILNYIWHAGHYPNSLPYRFSYIYIFFLIYIGYKGISLLSKTTNKTIVISTIASIILTVVCCMISGPNMTSLTLPVTIALFALYGIVIYVLKDGKQWKKILAIFLIALELIIPYANSFNYFEADSLYVHKDDVKYMNDTIAEKGDIFYRADLLKHNMNMPGALYNYKGMSTFTSVSYESVSKLQMQLGTNCNGLNSVHYQPQGPIYNLFMSMNYIVDNDDNFELNEKEFELIKEFETGSKLYANKYNSSIAFSSMTNLSETFNMAGTSPFDVQNKLASAITNQEIKVMMPVKGNEVVAEGFDIEIEETKQGLIIKYNKTSDDGFIKIITPVNKDGSYYLTTQNALQFDHITNYNGREMKKNQDIYPGSIGVGNLVADSTIETVISANTKTPTTGEMYFYASYADMDKMDELYSIVKENGIANVLEYKEDYVKFEIDSKSKYIFTTIPYDKNWEVKIDGKIIDNISQTSNALCLLEVEEGNHIVEFTYKQLSVTTGLCISGISILIFIAMILIDKKRNNKSES